eukprot:363119_1
MKETLIEVKTDPNYKPPSNTNTRNKLQKVKSKKSKRETNKNDACNDIECICKAKLIEMYRSQLKDKEIFCDNCNEEIQNKKNVVVYSCINTSELHTEGYDVCSKCAKKKKKKYRNSVV